MWYYTFPRNVDFLSKGLVEKHVLVIRIYYICSDQMYNPCIDTESLIHCSQSQDKCQEEGYTSGF